MKTQRKATKPVRYELVARKNLSKVATVVIRGCGRYWVVEDGMDHLLYDDLAYAIISEVNELLRQGCNEFTIRKEEI